VTLKRGQHSKYPPFAFTEQGVAMLSSVLLLRRMKNQKKIGYIKEGQAKYGKNSRLS
jgi:hypothetical protein